MTVGAVGVPGEHIPSGVQDRSRLFRSVLAAYAAEGQRVLVVVDNVSASEQARPLLPSDGACAAIVTSRHTLADLDSRLLNLDTLPEHEAVDLLAKALVLRDPADTRVHDHPDDAGRLAELCGGLPLALQITAALLAARTAKPLAVMADELTDADTRLEEMAYADRAVRAVFDTSYHQLLDTQARLFRLLSANPGTDISTTAASALADLPEADTRRNLDALARAHLIEPGTPYGRWRMHDLIRLHSAHYGRDHDDTDQRTRALTRLLAYYLLTTRMAGAHLTSRGVAPGGRRFATRAQALAWLDAEHLNLTAAIYTAATHPELLAFAYDLPHAMWGYLMWKRHFNDGITLGQIAIDAARTLGHRRGQAASLNCLGVALGETRRFEGAITALQDAVQIFHELGDQRGEGGALGNLGNALREMGRFEEAIHALQQNLQICREFGTPHGQGTALASLGTALTGMGRFEEAITALQDAVQIFHELGDQRGEGRALGNLGIAFGEAGRLEEAIHALQQNLQICREFGTPHDQGRALANLGNTQLNVGRFEDAIPTLRNAVQIFHDTGDRYGEGRSLTHLGIAVSEAGRFEEAITAYHQARAIADEFGDQYRHAAESVHLAQALAGAGRLDEALTVCREAVTQFAEVGDENDYTKSLSVLTALEQLESRPGT